MEADGFSVFAAVLGICKAMLRLIAVSPSTLPPSVEFTWVGVIIALLAFAQRLGGWESRKAAKLLSWVAGALGVGWLFVFISPLWGWIGTAMYWHCILWFLIPAARNTLFDKSKKSFQKAESTPEIEATFSGRTIDQKPTTIAISAPPSESKLETRLLLLGPSDVDILLDKGTTGEVTTSGVFVYVANRRHLDAKEIRVMVVSASSYDSVKRIFREPIRFKSAILTLNELKVRAGFKTQSAKWFLRISGDHLEIGDTNGMGVLEWPTADPSSKQRWLLKVLLHADGLPDWESFVLIEWFPNGDDILLVKSSDTLPAANIGLSVVNVWYEREGPTTPSTIRYRNKVRIAVRNDSSASIMLSSYWIANGRVSLQLPPRIVYRKELNEGSWRQNLYAGDEKESVFLDPGWVATTWIGLFEVLDDVQFGLARGSQEFGTLACKITIGSHQDEIRIPI